MKFQEYNPNSKHCDCIIRTFMKLLDEDYITVKGDLDEIAHSMGYDTYNETEVFEKYFDKNGYQKIDAEDILVNDLSFDNANYGVYCYKDDDYHLFPVIDRVAYDKNERFWKMRVINLYRKD